MNIKKTLSDSVTFLIPALLVGFWILGVFLLQDRFIRTQ